jgi:3-oxoacyl-[acyl-carrier-protein] synthase-1/3-oxoacyl-[acyl-carrier-protein] synthase II
MTPISIVAAGIVSPLGEGDAAVAVGAPGESPRSMVRNDAALGAGGLRHPLTARVALPVPAGVDPAAFFLDRAARALAEELGRVLPDWRSRKGAVYVGTSGGGMASVERALALRASGEPVPAHIARGAIYTGPLAVLDATFDPSWPRLQVLAACSSSAVTIGLGCRALEAGDVDLVIAGGYDALTALIACGFEALGATTRSAPRPFRLDRDGMALGEGAVLVALARAGDAEPRLGAVLGFAATADAVHVTAPDRRGNGLARAARGALADAGLTPADIDIVSAHATSTPHNDRAETAALASVFGSDLSRVVVHPFKAVIGHTLGAAGALESLAALAALRSGVLPAALGEGPLEDGFEGRLLERNGSGSPRTVLKLAAAFGGSNSALVLGLSPAHPSPVRSRRPSRVLFEQRRVSEPDLSLIAHRTRLDEIHLTRLDRASALAVTAVAQALDAKHELAVLDPERAAVIVSTQAASLEANELFDARRRAAGPKGVEPRRFPATSPNLPAGVCSIAFGFLGPSFAVGGGPGAAADAMAVARRLIEAGDADRVFVVCVDDVGAVVRDIFARSGESVPEPGASVTVLASAV